MRRPFPFSLTLLVALAACGDGPDANSPNRSQLADKWLARAKQSYRNGDAEDASVAIDGALKAAPRDKEARLLAARIALAKLDFEEAVKLTEGLQGSEAKALRGRAFWYAGDIERAAD
jgi:Tfp pilus assembly protein PilF